MEGRPGVVKPMRGSQKNRHPSFDCRGKTALITGAAGLLGKEHAEALLEAGAFVVVTDVDHARLAKLARRLSQRYSRKRFFSQAMDVTRPAEIARVSRILKTRRVDILVNNAAVDPKMDRAATGCLNLSRLEQFSLEKWRQEMDVGLTGAFLCSQIFGQKMAADGKGGVILNIASDLSVLAPDQRIYRKRGVPASRQAVKPVTYSVIKSGLVGLTRYLATYWAHRRIRSNALSPGGVYTSQPREFVRKLEELIPMGRMASPQEYRAAVQFLCSEASSYLTGQNIIMDGGRSVW